MTRTLRIAAIALLAATGAAQALEITEGVGFGNTQTEARINAIRAWIGQAVRDHGDGDWNGAMKTDMTCFQSGASGGAAVTGIGVEGPVTGAWSCTVRGIPLAALN